MGIEVDLPCYFTNPSAFIASLAAGRAARVWWRDLRSYLSFSFSKYHSMGRGKWPTLTLALSRRERGRDGAAGGSPALQ